jgi:crotonobetainyl-CoA:carnitine CoA-transferase CaiB-like acyl-CoA transferase
VLISIQNEREWVWLCEKVLKKPDVAIDPRFDSNTNRVENRPALDAIISMEFCNYTRVQLEGLLSEASIAYGVVSSCEDLVAHPQLQTVDIECEGGVTKMPAPPVWRKDIPLAEQQVFSEVPALGAHSEKIRQDFAE